jgi:hypothetical protein
LETQSTVNNAKDQESAAQPSVCVGKEAFFSCFAEMQMLKQTYDWLDKDKACNDYNTNDGMVVVCHVEVAKSKPSNCQSESKDLK